jgi:hypothetical protein
VEILICFGLYLTAGTTGRNSRPMLMFARERERYGSSLDISL